MTWIEILINLPFDSKGAFRGYCQVKNDDLNNLDNLKFLEIHNLCWFNDETDEMCVHSKQTDRKNNHLGYSSITRYAVKDIHRINFLTDDFIELWLERFE